MLVLIVVFGLAGVGIVLWLINKQKQSALKTVEEFKANWGKPVSVDRNFTLIAAYLETEPGNAQLDSAVIEDLDLESLFSYVDRCCSKAGQQYLFKKMNGFEAGLDKLTGLETKIAKVAGNTDARHQVQAQLSRLKHPNAYYIPELFNKNHKSVFHPLAAIYIRLAWVLVIAFVYLLIVTHSRFFLLGLFALIITNLLIHVNTKQRIFKYTRSIPQYLILNKIGQWLLKKGYIDADDNIKHSFQNSEALSKTLSLLNFQNIATIDPTDIVYLFTEWLNIGLLIEPLSFLKSLKKIDKYVSDIQILYQQVAEVDVAISIRSFRDGLPFYSIPVWDKEEVGFEAEELYHPLVENCVPNSIHIDTCRGVLITGSNMSGKTTFIRAIACNVLLAQTLNTTCTKKYRAPVLQVLTSIAVTDNLQAHKSYFQAEAISILEIITKSHNAAVGSLVIIDEIFKGTNTIERIAAAKAVLSHLTIHNNFVFVSTHDLELAEMLSNEYAIYSFAEYIDEDELSFDYRLRPGLLKKQNGIAVLDFLKYPKSIVAEALDVKKTLSAKYNL
jgi:hypothetical protein